MLRTRFALCISPDPDTMYVTHQSFNLSHFGAHTELFDKSFVPSTVRLWNKLSLDIWHSPSLHAFKAKLVQPKVMAIGTCSYLHIHQCLGASQLNVFVV